MYRYIVSREPFDRGKPYKVGTLRVQDKDWQDALARVEFLHNQGYRRVTIQGHDNWSGWTEVKTSRSSLYR